MESEYLDFQSFVDTCAAACAVLSVEKIGENGYGEIRILCANNHYKEVMGPAYYDNMLYYELVPKDLKFEDYCYRSAVKGEIMHAYVETKALDCWTDQKMIPLKSNRDDIGFCQFVSWRPVDARLVLRSAVVALSVLDGGVNNREVCP